MRSGRVTTVPADLDGTRHVFATDRLRHAPPGDVVDAKAQPARLPDRDRELDVRVAGNADRVARRERDAGLDGRGARGSGGEGIGGQPAGQRIPILPAMAIAIVSVALESQHPEQPVRLTLDAGREIQARTIVVVMGDHGESLSEHGEATHGFFVYDSTIRVPLLVRAPFSATLGGRRVTDVVRSVDVMPTLLDLLRIASTAAMC